MPTCFNCQKHFPNRIKIENEWKVLNSRKFCLECSPYQLHNTSRIAPVTTEGYRKCSTCYQIKPIFEFYRRATKSNKELRKHECKPCHNSRAKERLQNLKQKAVEFKGGKCCLCGYSKSIAALDFHHLAPRYKDFKISGRSVSFNTIITELNKCILVCANCHREIHAGLINLDEQKICLSCGKSLTNPAQDTYCSQECFRIASRKVKRPSKEDLQQLVWTKPTTQIAKDFGVSDKAIEKWCKAYGIQKPPRGYWAKQQSIQAPVAE